MKRIVLFILLAATAAHAQKQWTVEDIFRNGGPTGTPPRNIEWSPDGKFLTFLAPDNTIGKTGDLLALDTATNKISVLATQDKLTAASISEIAKDHRARYGMPSYTWAADSKHLILDAGGVISLYDIVSQTATRIVDTRNGSGDDPKFSPDAKTISYLRDHNLYIAPAEPNTHKELNLTNTTGDTLLNGEVDWVYLEELEVRSNYFWSPDSEHIAYLQADESKVPEYPLTNLSGPHATVDMRRYPQPGDPNPTVRVGVVSAHGGKTRWLNIPQSPGNDYIPRFGWIDAHTLYVELLTRDQKSLNIYLADANSGKTKLILTYKDEKYLDTNYDITFYDNSHFILKSWRDGHAHLYLYAIDAKHPLDATATLVKQLTQGDYEVQQLLAVDTKTQTVFYLSTEDNPLENALWSIHLDGTEKTRLIANSPPQLLNLPCVAPNPADGTIPECVIENLPLQENRIAMPPGVTESKPGTHYISLSPDFTHFVDMGSATLSPYDISLCNLDDDCTTIWKPKNLYDLGYRTIQPQSLALKTKDGTTLYGSLILPKCNCKAPLILNPYGGPHEQSVTDSWGGAAQLFDQLLAQHGFAVLVIDNRGMGGRGREFEQASYKNFGPIQIEDQLTALDQVLKQFPQLNPEKIGIWGWSYGGTLTLYAMEHSDRFKTGIAVAPVTDWRLYDSIYTERYLGLPSANSAVYDRDATVKSAAKLHGKLLLIHGTGDDNVHLANSIQQQQALMDAHIPFDLQLYPNKTHSIAGTETRIHLFNRILQYFETNLK